MINPGAGLTKALKRRMPQFLAPGARITRAEFRSWASTNFTGHRVRFVVEADAATIEPVDPMVQEHEFDLMWILVADVHIEPLSDRNGRPVRAVEFLLLDSPPDE